MTVHAIHANDGDSTDNWCGPNCILLYQRVFESTENGPRCGTRDTSHRQRHAILVAKATPTDYSQWLHHKPLKFRNGSNLAASFFIKH